MRKIGSGGHPAGIVKKPDVAAMALVALLLATSLLVPSAGATVAPAARGHHPPTVFADDWPTYLHDGQRSGYNSGSTSIGNASQLVQVWSTKFNRSLWGSVIVVNRTVYLGVENGYFAAVNASTGAPLPAARWALPFLGDTGYSQCGVAPNYTGTDNGIVATATYQGGVLYQSGGNTSFYQVSSAGRIMSRTDVGNSSATPWRYVYLWASPLIYNGYAYEGVAALCEYNGGNSPPYKYVQGQLLQIQLSNGRIVHMFNVTKAVNSADVGGSVWSTPSIDPTTNTVWITTGNANASRETPANGEYPQSIVALNASDLVLRGGCQTAAAGWANTLVDDDYGAGPTLFSDPRGDRFVGALNKNGTFYALNATQFTGGSSPQCNGGSLTLAWSKSFGIGGDPGPIAPAAFDGTHVYIATGAAGGCTCSSGPGSVEALNPGNGHVVWSASMNRLFPATAHAGVAVADGVVYIAANNNSNGNGSGTDGELLAYNATSGFLEFQHQFNESISGEPVIAEGRVYIASGAGSDKGPGYLDAFGPSLNLTAPFPSGCNPATVTTGSVVNVNHTGGTGMMSFFAPSSLNGTGTLSAYVAASKFGAATGGFQYLFSGCEPIAPGGGTVHLSVFFNVSGTDTFTSTCALGGSATANSNVSAVAYATGPPGKGRLGPTSLALWSDSKSCTTTTVHHALSAYTLSTSFTATGSNYYSFWFVILDSGGAGGTLGATETARDTAHWTVSEIRIT